MKKNSSAFWGWLICIVPILFGILLLCTAIQSMIAYNHIKENPVTVTAIVTKYEEDTKTDADGVDKLEYDLYMTYSYEGKEYSTKYDTVSWKSHAEAALGKTVQIQINPDNPDSSSNEHSDYVFGFILSIGMIGVGIFLTCLQISSKKNA